MIKKIVFIGTYLFALAGAIRSLPYLQQITEVDCTLAKKLPVQT